MKNMVNRVHLEGRVYEHSLVKKTVQNTESKNYGKDFISGNLEIATDDECLNVVTVHFTYVTAITSKGANNRTYDILNNIINNGKTVVIDGIDAATMVSVDSAVDLNDFYSNRNGGEELVSVKRVEGGFVTIVKSLNEKVAERNQFNVDMIINGTRRVEADPEKDIENDYVVVKGAIFNFRNAILPIELVVKSNDGMRYFEGLDASPSNITFTRVWGPIMSQTIVTRQEEASAFGEPAVRETSRTVREWIIVGSRPEVYEFDDESTITKADIQKAMADREVYLADAKKRAQEFQAARQASPVSVADAAPAQGGFNF